MSTECTCCGLGEHDCCCTFNEAAKRNRELEAEVAAAKIINQKDLEVMNSLQAKLAVAQKHLAWCLSNLERPAWAKTNIDPDHVHFDREYAEAREALARLAEGEAGT